MWGIKKDAVYAQKPRGVEHMKTLIGTKFAKINTNKDLLLSLVQWLKEAFYAFIMMMDTLNSSCSNLHTSVICCDL
jgi:hypothetical protein